LTEPVGAAGGRRKKKTSFLFPPDAAATAALAILGAGRFVRVLERVLCTKNTPG
jgi:hypothetical protein